MAKQNLWLITNTDVPASYYYFERSRIRDEQREMSVRSDDVSFLQRANVMKYNLLDAKGLKIFLCSLDYK